MSQRLVTQLSDESPRVLLVGEESSLKRKIESFLSRQGLELDSSLSLFKQEDLSKALSRNYYKIIVIGSGEDLKNNVLKLRQKKNVLVINLISSIDPDSYLSSHSNLIVGQDIIPQGSTEWPFFKTITKNISKGLILDPQIDLYLQSENVFFNSIKREILSPQKRRVISRGKKHHSDIIIREIQRLLSLFNPSMDFEVKTDVKKSYKNSFAGFEELTGEIEALPSILEESVRNIKFDSHSHPKEPKPIFHSRTLDRPQQIKTEVQPTIKPTFSQERVLTTPAREPKDDLVKETFDIPYLKESPIVIRPTSKQASTQEKKENVDEKLGKIFKVKRVDKKVERVKEIVKETKKINKKTKKNKFLFGIGTIITVIAVSMLIFTGLFIFSTSRLEKELTNVFLKFSQDEAAEIDYSGVERSSDFLEKQISLYEQALPPELFIDSINLIEISQKIVEYDKYSKDFKSDTEDLVTSFLGKDLLEDILSSQKPAKTAQAYYETASRLLSRLHDFKDTQKEGDKQEKVSEFISYVESQKSSLLVYQQLSPVFDLLFGKDGKKTYAVVFQNNQELRPTGGFIQAVALLTVDQGMLVDSQVFSSYELDKNLGGSVVPPDEIIKLLGENKWYLRDSNWDPDFVNSSKQISWFLEQETNRKIDGVVGINLFVLENILKELGPLELDEYNEIITDKNIFERSEFHSEIKLVESSEVEDYQANLLKYLLRDMVIKGQDNPAGLLKSLSKSIKEKQMVVAMSDTQVSQPLTLLGWSGQLINPKCPNQLSALPCQVDSLIINEANIGINKANYHTTREDTHLIEIQETQAKHFREITLSNKAFSNAWPKGLYKAYFRLYLPLSIDSISITIDGEKISEDNYKIIKQENHQTIGLLIETPIKSDKKINIEYVVPIEFSLPYSYAFFNQKQPGTANILPQVIISHDSSLSPTLIAPQAEVKGSSIIFDKLGEDHAFIGVSFK
ncbi:MAG: DUF4012 domain-containing protein [Candidatus Pacebacteria bacterium]|nr:DUF4012 domain-containing protein [Candidatus Paceibacterota bacterium]